MCVLDSVLLVDYYSVWQILSSGHNVADVYCL